MILLLDAGNTRIKWGLWQADEWLAEGALATTDVSALTHALVGFTSIQQILAANVAGPLVKAEITQALTDIGTVDWLNSSSQCCGVTNHYKNPEQLGVDRWASLIAANAMNRRPCIVVTAGTATTIDILDEHGGFRGGVILPGVTLMRTALAGSTAQLPLASGHYCDSPQNTADAIVTGSIEAQIGAIERMYARAAKLGNAACLLSGGSAPELEPFLSIPFNRADNLVLKGLAQIAKNSNESSVRR